LFSGSSQSHSVFSTRRNCASCCLLVSCCIDSFGTVSLYGSRSHILNGLLKLQETLWSDPPRRRLTGEYTCAGSACDCRYAPTAFLSRLDRRLSLSRAVPAIHTSRWRGERGSKLRPYQRQDALRVETGFPYPHRDSRQRRVLPGAYSRRPLQCARNKWTCRASDPVEPDNHYRQGWVTRSSRMTI
jgi:hypothetical protein